MTEGRVSDDLAREQFGVEHQAGGRHLLTEVDDHLAEYGIASPQRVARSTLWAIVAAGRGAGPHRAELDAHAVTGEHHGQGPRSRRA